MSGVVWVSVRLEVPCCMLWYLGSGSWVRPSGSLRSRRSEACNYWSPPGPLWGRYGSSDACCSCAEAQENLKKKKGGRTCVFQHMCVRVCIKQTVQLFLVWTAWVKQSHWRGERGCVSARATQAESTLGSRGLEFFSDSRVETSMAKKHQFWADVQLSFRWPQSIKFKLRFHWKFMSLHASQ